MSFKSMLTSDHVARYVNETMLHDTDLHRRLREETALMPNGGMQVSRDQGAFLAFMVGLIGAKKCLEVGTFTGYSALCTAAALPKDGKLVCCDVSDEWTSVGRRYWQEAGLAERIDLRLGQGTDTLLRMIASGESGTFDFAFIDADKESYPEYFESVLRLLRVGGLMVMDNVLGSGPETTEVAYDPAGCPRHPLNLKIRDDVRVEAMIFTVGAGMWVVRKK